jgi:hypothetical protein
MVYHVVGVQVKVQYRSQHLVFQGANELDLTDQLVQMGQLLGLLMKVLM